MTFAQREIGQSADDGTKWVAILVYIGFRYNAPTRFRYIHIYIHRI